MRYDYTYLKSFCEENNIMLSEDYDNVNIFTIINGICKNENCENNFSKSFRSLVKTNGYCLICAKELGNTKAKQTCLKKYGVENPNKSEDIKGKIKKTCLEKYGVEYISQAEEIKEKVKQTNLDKYGVVCTLHNKEIKEKVKQTWFSKYGVESSNQAEEIKQKKKKSYLNKYGVLHPSQSDEIKQKKKETCMSNFGVEFPTQSNLVIDKMKDNNFKKYGKAHILQVEEFREKGKQTSLQKYGFEYPMKSEVIKQKVKQTNLDKYGVEYVSQSTEIMEKMSKNAYKFKNYIFPSGRIEKVQGTEPYALNEILNVEYINENDIIVGAKNVPIIWYYDEFDKKHRHYVDIFIKSQNRCIECKSTWTKLKNEHNIYLKQNAAKELGYKYEIWIYDKKGVRINIIE
jgi:hypothetical protein